MKKRTPEYYCKIVKQNIRRCKEEMDWTIPQMARKINISEGYLGSILSMKSNKVPTIYTLGQICQTTKKEISYFFEDKNI